MGSNFKGFHAKFPTPDRPIRTPVESRARQFDARWTSSRGAPNRGIDALARRRPNAAQSFDPATGWKPRLHSVMANRPLEYIEDLRGR